MGSKEIWSKNVCRLIIRTSVKIFVKVSTSILTRDSLQSDLSTHPFTRLKNSSLLSENLKTRILKEGLKVSVLNSWNQFTFWRWRLDAISNLRKKVELLISLSCLSPQSHGYWLLCKVQSFKNYIFDI